MNYYRIGVIFGSQEATVHAETPKKAIKRAALALGLSPERLQVKHVIVGPETAAVVKAEEKALRDVNAARAKAGLRPLSPLRRLR